MMKEILDMAQKPAVFKCFAGGWPNGENYFQKLPNFDT